MGWELRAVAAAAASRREMSGETQWDGCTDNQWPVVNDHIMLHADDAQCVWPHFPVVTHYSLTFTYIVTNK